MSTQTKARVLVCFLVAFAIWPLVHRGLVYQLDLSPWKFMGWAMYCRPENHISVQLYERVGGEDRRLPGATMAPAEQRLIKGFVRQRMYYGVLASPDRIARAARATRPWLRDLVIEVTNTKLEPGPNTFEPTVYRYVYPRRP